MKTRKMRLYSAALAAVLSIGSLSLCAARPAAADKEDTYRIATYGLGAATLFGVVKKKPVVAIVGAAGTYFAHKKWKDAVRDRRGDHRHPRRSRDRD